MPVRETQPMMQVGQRLAMHRANGIPGMKASIRRMSRSVRSAAAHHLRSPCLRWALGQHPGGVGAGAAKVHQRQGNSWTRSDCPASSKSALALSSTSADAASGKRLRDGSQRHGAGLDEHRPAWPGGERRCSADPDVKFGWAGVALSRSAYKPGRALETAVLVVDDTWCHRQPGPSQPASARRRRYGMPASGMASPSHVQQWLVLTCRAQRPA